MLKSWLKLYLYQIKNNKFFTFLNILGLSIGISGLLFSILYWNEEHSYDAWNPGKEQVHQVLVDMGEMVLNSNPSPLEAHLKTFNELESYCYLQNRYLTDIIQHKEKKEMISKIINAQTTFFSFFPFQFIKGTSSNALLDNTSIALSENTALRLFGNEEPIGKQVQYDGKTFVVRGVYKIQGKSSMAPEAVVSLVQENLDKSKEDWGSFRYSLLLKLKNPEDANSLEKKIENLFYQNRTLKRAKEEGIAVQEFIKKYGKDVIILESLKTARLYSKDSKYLEGKGNYQFLMIMVGLSILILILSIFNYVNLATANAIKRAKEIGIHKVMGASKANIIKQFLFETVITTCFSIFIALVIVELSMPFYNDFLEKELSVKESQFYIQLVFIFIIVVITAGIFPAMYVANFESLKVLKGNFSRSKKGIWLRNGMLVLQFAIASFFIIGSYIVYEQIAYLSQKDLGFQGNQIIDVTYNDDEESSDALYENFLTVKNELMKIDGVEEVSTGTFSLGNGTNSSSNISYKELNIQVQDMAVDFGTLDMMKIKIAQGRNLSQNLASDTISSIMINETAMKLLMEKNPIGKELQWGDKKLKIVGVVKDFHLFGPEAEIPPMTFFHIKTTEMAYDLRVFIKIDSQKMEQTLAAIERFWNKKVDQKYPFEYDFIDKNYARTYQNYVNQRNLFSLLNGIVILIALFGLFALASYSIQRRMKEIAIRKTLGAETKTLLAALSKQYIIFCVIGFLMALFPVYYLLEMWLENFVFRIEISILPFLIGFFTLMILTLTVVISRAYGATKMNVLKYLKYE